MIAHHLFRFELLAKKLQIPSIFSSKPAVSNSNGKQGKRVNFEFKVFHMPIKQ